MGASSLPLSSILRCLYSLYYIYLGTVFSVQELLPQRECDGYETRNYYGVPHGVCRN